MPLAPPLTLIFDPAAVHPELDQARQALQVGDWTGVRAIFGRSDRATRNALAWHLAETPGATDRLTALAGADPTDPVAALVLATNLITVGWSIRTDAAAEQVSREQFRAFQDHLRRAEQVLIDLTARDPGNAVAWSMRLVTARGLQLGQAEARRRYGRVLRHDPHAFYAQRALLQQLCPKWGGSIERAHTFASECALAAPAGSFNAELVLEGHLEHALEQGGRTVDHLRTPDVQRDIRGAAARSVLDPHFRHTFGWVGVRNSFAMFFSVVGDHAAAAAQFLALGQFATEQPWHHLGDPAEQFLRYRALALGYGPTR